MLGGCHASYGEQMNKKFKANLRSQRALVTQQSILESLDECTAAWSRPLSLEEAEHKPLTLLGPRLASAPTTPDQWMIGTGGMRLRKPFCKMEVHATILQWLKRMRLPNSRYFEHDSHARRRWICLFRSRPGTMPRGALHRLRRQLLTRNVTHLQRNLVEEGVLQETGMNDAPFKLHVESLHAMWGKYSLVWLPEDDGEKASCTCWMCSWKGHCTHYYAALEWWGVRSFVGRELEE